MTNIAFAPDVKLDELRGKLLTIVCEIVSGKGGKPELRALPSSHDDARRALGRTAGLPLLASRQSHSRSMQGPKLWHILTRLDPTQSRS